MMQTCSLLLGTLHSVAAFCTPTPDDDGWKTADCIALASAIATGLGVFTALGAAILVPYFQTRHLAAKEVAKEKSEVRSFLRAIRAEVNVTWANYARIRPDWDELQKGQHVEQTVLFSDNSFSIYGNAGAQLGRVSSSELQESIVATYGLAKSLILTFQINNAMLQDLRETQAIPLDGGTHMPRPRVDKIDQLNANLTAQAESLRDLDKSLKQRVDDLLKEIDNFLNCS